MRNRKHFSMKQLYTLLLLLFFFGTSQAQTIVRERKPVQVYSPQTFYLNGGNRATFGGKSRVWYNIQLPENTVEWYYSFTTTKGQDPTENIQLMS